MAYFRCVGGVGGGAVLTLTYSSEFYGETITATDGTKTVTKVAPSTGTMDITLPESGTWVVSATISGQTYSTTVTVDIGYSATLFAIPDGSTVTPTDDIQTWLRCAGITDKTTYTTLSDVLGDTETLIALCADSNACDYMARSTTWASGVAADSTAMLIVGKYNYCANALLGNSTWASAICNSTYFESVLNVKVPVMTSNTTPSGTAFASSYYTTDANSNAWCGFNPSYNWTAAQGSSLPQWLAYKFPYPVIINKVVFCSYSNRVTKLKVQASNDDFVSDIHDLTDEVAVSQDYNNPNVECFANSTPYTSFRYYCTESGDGLWHSLRGMNNQFYGRTPVSQDYTLIHSAVEDSIFYMNEGTPVPLCAISSGDTEDVDMSSFTGQTLTLVSTVAKDPTNLSNDFSMNVRITPNITEIYLMPLKELYWYGHVSNLLEDCTSANGWTNGTYSVPNYLTNYIDLLASSNTFTGVGIKNDISPTIVKCIAQGVQIRSGAYGYLAVTPAKRVFDGASEYTVIDSTSLALYTHNGGSNVYLSSWGMNASGIAESKLYALWFE